METTQIAETPELAQHDTLPEFPRLSGPLGSLVEGITHDIPYEYKAMSVLSYVGLALSGRTELASPYDKLQPRFYTCLVGPKGSGKSAAQKEVNKALEGLGNVSVEQSINSGPALVVALTENHRLLYSPDELNGAFQKAKAGSMFDDFKTLYEDNKISNRVKNKAPIVATGCHFAIIGGCTRDTFGKMWSGIRGSDELQSRFVLAFSEQCMPRRRTGSNNDPVISLAVEELKHVLSNVPTRIELPEQDGAFTEGLMGDGSHINLDYSRVVDMGRRFALIVAACEGKTRIDDETMKLGRAFIDYQIAAYEPLLPPDAKGFVEKYEKRILPFFEKHQPASFRDCRNNIRPENSPGGFGPFKSAWNNLVSTGKLLPAGDANRVGTVKYKLDTESALPPAS
jgi:hypothetical protein